VIQYGYESCVTYIQKTVRGKIARMRTVRERQILIFLSLQASVTTIQSWFRALLAAQVRVRVRVRVRVEVRVRWFRLELGLRLDLGLEVRVRVRDSNYSVLVSIYSTCLFK
jgi:hypothetical protein